MYVLNEKHVPMNMWVFQLSHHKIKVKLVT